MNGVKALTLTQPWATLVVVRAKRIETRSWDTKHRGTIGIHAAKGMPRWAVDLCFEEPFRAALLEAGITGPPLLPRGALVGHAVLLDTMRTEAVPREILSHTERDFGDYTPGRFAWLLGEATLLSASVPMKGALGLWTMP